MSGVEDRPRQWLIRTERDDDHAQLAVQAQLLEALYSANRPPCLSHATLIVFVVDDKISVRESLELLIASPDRDGRGVEEDLGIRSSRLFPHRIEDS